VFWYSPHRHPPSEPSSLLSVSSISETDQFPTIQKGSLITHYKLPFLGLFQGLIPDRLVLFLLPLLLLFLLRLPFLMLLFIAFTGCCYSSLGLLFNAPLFNSRLSLDLFQILFQIRVHWNRLWVYDSGCNGPSVYVLGGRHTGAM